MRPRAAVVVLLVVAVPVHVLMPHHTPAGSNGGSVTYAAESEARNWYGSTLPHARTGTGARHYEATADSVTLAPRTGQAVLPGETGDAAAGPKTASPLAVSGALQARTARCASKFWRRTRARPHGTAGLPLLTGGVPCPPILS